MCCLHKVRWRGQKAQFVGCRGMSYKLWWSGNNDKRSCNLVKEELCKKVVDVQRKSDRMMAMVLVFEENVIEIICAYFSQVGRSECEKDQFVITWQVSGICKTLVKWFLV